MKTLHPIKCILYAEDEPDDVFFLEYAFGKAGINHPLKVVNDGDHVIKYLSKKAPFTDSKLHPDPCLILLDINLPKKNGHEVLQWIRGQSSFTSVPVVMLTSSEHPADVDKARQFSADGYFVKAMKLPDMVKFAKAIHTRWLSPMGTAQESSKRPPRTAG